MGKVAWRSTRRKIIWARKLIIYNDKPLGVDAPRGLSVRKCVGFQSFPGKPGKFCCEEITAGAPLDHVETQ